MIRVIIINNYDYNYNNINYYYNNINYNNNNDNNNNNDLKFKICNYKRMANHLG